MFTTIHAILRPVQRRRFLFSFHYLFYPMHRNLVSPERFQTPLVEVTEDEKGDEDEEEKLSEDEEKEEKSRLLEKIKRLEEENKELKRIIASYPSLPSPTQPTQTTTPPFATPPRAPTQTSTPQAAPAQTSSQIQQHVPIISPRPQLHLGIGSSDIVENLERMSFISGENFRR
jgi:hypothetical protein